MVEEVDITTISLVIGIAISSRNNYNPLDLRNCLRNCNHLLRNTEMDLHPLRSEGSVKTYILFRLNAVQAFPDKIIASMVRYVYRY